MRAINSVLDPKLALPNVLSVLNEATHALADVSDVAHQEAVLLLQHVTGLTRAHIYAYPEQQLTAQAVTRVHALLSRRCQGEPLAYILGTQAFWSLELSVDPAVLIPRAETEQVVARALSHLPQQMPVNVLDLGTGSGAIALAIAQARPQASVVAVDNSAAALQVAQHNAIQLSLHKVIFVHSDFYQALPATRFDVIVSNPPYIAQHDPELEAAVLATEPHMALIAGPTGLEKLQTVIAGAPRHLNPKGWLIVEHGWRQAAAVQALFVQAGFIDVVSHLDLSGKARVMEGRWRVR